MRWWQQRETDRFKPGTLRLREGLLSFQYPNHTAYAVFDEKTREHLFDIPYALVQRDGTAELSHGPAGPNRSLAWDEVQP